MPTSRCSGGFEGGASGISWTVGLKDAAGQIHRDGRRSSADIAGRIIFDQLEARETWKTAKTFEGTRESVRGETARDRRADAGSIARIDCIEIERNAEARSAIAGDFDGMAQGRVQADAGDLGPG